MPLPCSFTACKRCLFKEARLRYKAKAGRVRVSKKKWQGLERQIV